MRARAAAQRRDAGTLARLLAGVASDHESIAAIYLFGSQARGTPTPLSDIDVALLCAGESTAADLCGQVADTIARQCGTDRVDVIALTDAPLPLRYRVIREGTLVARRDAASLQRFIADTVRQYLDIQPLRDRAFQVLRKNIRATADGR